MREAVCCYGRGGLDLGFNGEDPGDTKQTGFVYPMKSIETLLPDRC